MTEKEMRRLGRTELLEMLLEQSRENERLQEKVQELEEKLQNKEIHLNKAGSIAEAALSLNRVFEAAEASCIQYIENIHMLNERQTVVNKEREEKSKEEAAVMLSETQARCMMMEEETKKQCEERIRETDKRVEERWAQISQRLTALYQSHEGLMELVSQGVSLVSGRGGADGSKEE